MISRVEQVNKLENISDTSNRSEVGEIEATLPRVTEEYRPHPSDNVVGLPVQKKYSTIEILKSRSISDFTDTYLKDMLPALDEQYKLLEILGSGGMANVFKVEKNGFYYALKLLKDELLDEKRLNRFKNEIELMKKFNSHPNILSIIDSGNYIGRPCIVEEFADGKTLHEQMKTIHPNKLIQYMIQISRALYFIHENGYIHMDLKPENIFLVGKVVKVGDFGIAKMINSSNTEAHTNGFVLGTLRYMSPEEAKQALEPKDDFVQTLQSDIYSIGVMLYEGLTGQLPVQITKNDNEKVGIIASLRKISTVQPKPVCELNPKINSQLAATVMALLEKDPHERSRLFKDAEAVAKRLTMYLENGQIITEDKAA